eukprot:8062575-Karenia_brevis.AAC.1
MGVVAHPEMKTYLGTCPDYKGGHFRPGLPSHHWRQIRFSQAGQPVSEKPPVDMIDPLAHPSG